MPTARAEKTIERSSRRPVAGPVGSVRGVGTCDLLDQLVRRLRDLDARDEGGAVALALDVLGRGLGADRIDFHRPIGPVEAERFESAAGWSRTPDAGGAPPRSIDLPLLPERIYRAIHD